MAEVFTVLARAGLVIKEAKCSFRLSEVKLLGFVVCADGLKADPDKVPAIRDMAPPTDKKGVGELLLPTYGGLCRCGGTTHPSDKTVCEV